MQTNPAVLAWLSRGVQQNPLAGDGVNMQTRPPVIKDPIVEVFVLREIFVNGTAREVGSKAVMQASDAWALSNSVPPAVSFVK
jgi:hypothetical protein